MDELKDHINKELYEECSEFIKNVTESGHTNILKRHLNKCNRLCQSNKGLPLKLHRWLPKKLTALQVLL